MQLFIAVFLLCATRGAFAQEPRSAAYQIEVELGDCIQDAGDDFAQRQNCYKVPIKLAESQLRAAYGLFTDSSLSDDKKRKLQDIQERWEQFREADCQFLGGLVLSSPWPLLAKEDCYLKHTLQRTNELTWQAILHLPPKEMQGKLPLRGK